jgi:thiol-disulfide isomerase/thioredoxin
VLETRLGVFLFGTTFFIVPFNAAIAKQPGMKETGPDSDARDMTVTNFAMRQRTSFSICLVIASAAFLAGTLPAAVSDTNNAAPGAISDADKAWKEVEQALQPPPLPAEWAGQRPTAEQVERFRSEQGRLAGAAADKARDFYTRFPDHAKAATARQKQQEMLQVAVRLGNTGKATDLEQIETEKLKDPNLSEDERFKLRMAAVNRRLNSKLDADEAEWTAEAEKAARVLIREFPKREGGYQMLLSAAEHSEVDRARVLAKEVIAGSGSEEIKGWSEGLIRKLDALGRPLDIKFTALDGREVDVGKMTGKVVLIDFWATWCAPCVAEIPNVKQAYGNLHSKGFEIVGISFDDDKEKLQKFVSKEQMPWPQFFGGADRGNKFGQQYGIRGIPTMWLVDKKGNLREMNARDGLEARVEKLLAD